MSNSKFTRHAIQLRDLKVLTLSLKINPEKEQDKLPEFGSFRLYHGYSEFDDESQQIAVKIGIEIDSNQDDSPFDLEVELLGVFNVDLERFKEEFIEDWASKNAPLILYPYLREQVHGLTNRAGFEGLLLPLFEVPTFKLQK